MKKLRFNLDDLQVQSFDTTADRRAMPRGTVLGQTDQYPIEMTSEQDPACNPNYTQGSSCQNGGESCDGCGHTDHTCGGAECVMWTSACDNTNQGSPCNSNQCGSTSLCTGQTCYGSTCAHQLSCGGPTCSC